MKNRIVKLAALIVVGLSFPLRAQPSDHLPAPLPEFMSQQQLAKWNEDRAGVQTTSYQVVLGSTFFYTGKPYVSEAGGYIFKYRTYCPEMSRWTSIDPCGFPNGANNSIYAPPPSCGLDPDGRFYSGKSYWGRSVDETAWDSIELASSAYPLGVEAMEHADGTTPGNWTLSASEAAQVKASSDYTGTYYAAVKAALGSPTAGPDSTPVDHFLFTHGTDEYYAFGHADLSTSGTVTFDANGQWTYTATVTLTDAYSFSKYGSVSYLTPTGLGYRLQKAGYIKAFTTSGTWTDTWTE